MVHQSTYAKVEFKPKMNISNRHIHNFSLKSNLFIYVFPDSVPYLFGHIEYQKTPNGSEN